MPVKLIPPGARKRNPFWLLRGTLGGRRVEVSTQARDKAAAEAFAERFLAAWRQGRVPGAGEAVTFAQAARHYIAWRQPAAGDIRRIGRLVALLDNRLIGDIAQADIVAAAGELYPAAAPATWNRAVIKPAAAILHYAAHNGWCPWLRLRKFKEARPATRRADPAALTALLAAVDGEIAARARDHARAAAAGRRTAGTGKRLHAARRKRLLVVWLFHEWTRISDTLRIRADHIDLPARTYRIYIGKAGAWKVKPISDEVFECLANEPPGALSGPLFPWSNKTSVYNWLRPLTRRLGLHFTPHMARHYGGWALNRSGAGLKTIMAALDHSDPQSSIRYQDADTEIVRAAKARLRADLAPSPAPAPRPRRGGIAGERRRKPA